MYKKDYSLNISEEKIFKAFEKVPDVLWEEEYNKYMQILDKYKNIKILRWEEQ